MITTIQLSKELKMILSKMKKNSHETYEEVILRLIDQIKESERENKGLLKQGYMEMADETRKTDEEWSAAEQGWE